MLVAPSGIEPLSKVPETFVLSIKLRSHYQDAKIPTEKPRRKLKDKKPELEARGGKAVHIIKVVKHFSFEGLFQPRPPRQVIIQSSEKFQILLVWLTKSISSSVFIFHAYSIQPIYLE